MLCGPYPISFNSAPDRASLQPPGLQKDASFKRCSPSVWTRSALWTTYASRFPHGRSRQMLGLNRPPNRSARATAVFSALPSGGSIKLDGLDAIRMFRNLNTEIIDRLFQIKPSPFPPPILLRRGVVENAEGLHGGCQNWIGFVGDDPLFPDLFHHGSGNIRGLGRLAVHPDAGDVVNPTRGRLIEQAFRLGRVQAKQRVDRISDVDDVETGVGRNIG